MLKVGILGGGQLGRMLLQAAANYQVETHVLEDDTNCPAAHLCHHFEKGAIGDFDAVYNFGKRLDALTIEIENVNIDALEKLEQEGKRYSQNLPYCVSSKIKFYKSNIILNIKFLRLHI